MLGILLLAAVSTGAAAVGLPVETRTVAPERFVTNGNGRVFVDFGKDAFGWLELLPPPGFTGGVYQVMVGEAKVPGESINWWAGGSIRTGWNKEPAFMPPCDVFRVPFEADERNTRTDGPTPAVQMRPEVGVVQPFRYAEFFEAPFEVTPERVRQVAVNYPMDMTASSFESSSPILNAVYGFCKYSILATSFAGLYVDGDRERIPYEGDAYINQLGHYAVDCDTKLARATLDYLMEHPTWPTEWKQHAIMMAWADWMWSGETVSLERFYDRLKNDKLMLSRARADGLLTSLPQKISSQDDLIDWPPADRDGFEFRPVNAVVNAFHYRNLVEMTDIARVLGKDDDVRFFEARAASVRDAYRRVFLDAKRGLCTDGEGSAHASLHANAVALAFGLLDQGEERAVADYLAGRGMACSTYFSQYLMEALFRGGRADAAVALMSARGDRSWHGMMEQGATMTMEAWSLADKPNQDWNHAWGTVPLNVISRLVLGVTPLKPGFEKVSIRPNTGGLEHIKGTVPTVKGSVSVETQGDVLLVTVPVPAVVVWKGRSHEISAGRVEIDAKGVVRPAGKAVVRQLRDDCWMWGHDAGHLDGPGNMWRLPVSGKMEMVESCRFMGLENLNVIRWGNPPKSYREKFRNMKRLTWPICGHKDEADATFEDMCEYDFRLVDEMPNLVGFEMDDFFREKEPLIVVQTEKGPRMSYQSAFSYEKLLSLHRRMKSCDRSLELRLVVYDELLSGEHPEAIVPCAEQVDVLTYWTWKADDIVDFEKRFSQLRALLPDKPVFIGVYLWDFGGRAPMPVERIAYQLERGLEFWARGEAAGFVFLATSVCGKELESVRYVRQWIADHGEMRR